ncbi:MAG: hydroxyacid dehydrogenase [Ruminococcaceae bacterium]|nr:hydroxyacid dehydrogenase [Oscillospiraceae bacterium]
MKITVLDASTLGDDLDLGCFEEFGEVTVRHTTPPELVEEALWDSDVAVLNKVKLGETNLKNLKKLKLVCVAATGFDNIDTAYLKKRGIALYNVPGYCTAGVVQVTVAMALSLVTKLESYRDYVHSGRYSAGGVANKVSPYYREIGSLTWGVVGGGAIGRGVATAAKALGARVLMCRRKPEREFESCDIDTLCKKSDIISLHVPLNGETENMINTKRIASMKNGAVLVNVSRGKVCDELALTEAVLSGKLGGLGMDVYSAEPMSKDHPYNRIVHLDNVCLTPHMAWGAVEARKRCIRIICDNIRSFMAEKGPNRVV